MPKLFARDTRIQPPPKLTRQGVRDLNGPRMDGAAYNGRPASCPHYKNPHTPTRRERRLGLTETDPPREFYVCVLCGDERFDAEER